MSETRFWLTEERLDPAAVARLIEDPGCGAVVTFVGNVRRDNEGRDVDYLEYEAYPGMAEAKMAEAEANLRLADNDLEKTVIRAPIDGVIGNRAVRVGQFVQPGSQLLSLVPNDVHIVGVSQTPVNRDPQVRARELAATAVRDALAHTKIPKSRVGALFVGNMTGGILEQQLQLGSLIADYAGLAGIDAVNIEAARASIEADRSTESYAKKRASDVARRERTQAEYVVTFEVEVETFLRFSPQWRELGTAMAKLVATHAMVLAEA